MIYIMTPCSRPENLSKIKDTIPKDCTWVVLFDKSVGPMDECVADICISSKNTGYYGNPLRNEFLDTFMEKFTDDDWVYILDDDNIIHPEWYSTITKFFNNKESDVNFINWGQVNRLPPAIKPRVGTIDTACFMYKPKSFPTMRYDMDYTSDGNFVVNLFEVSNPTTIMKELCYYNFLDPRVNKEIIDVDNIKMENVHPTLIQFLHQIEEDSKKKTS